MTNKIGLSDHEQKILMAIKENIPFEALAQKMKITLRTLRYFYLKILLLKYQCATIEELQKKIK